MKSIKSYKLFLESIFSKTTACLYYSARFRHILERLRPIDSVAELLLYAESNIRYKGDVTFIDVTDKEDMVSFIQVNRAEKYLIVDEDSEETYAHHFEKSLRSIWYQTKDTRDHEIWKNQRTTISIGRLVTKITQSGKVPLTQAEIEKFSNLYKSTWKIINDAESAFELVEGEDIRKYYLESNYEKLGIGSLGKSCMRKNECQSFFDIYVKNPQVCKLLILKSIQPGKISGRALVWTLEDGGTYMDRQYTTHDHDEIVFQEYAKKKGWLYYKKEPTAWGEKVQLGDFDYKEYPYMDTFEYYDFEEKLLICPYKDGTIDIDGDLETWPNERLYLLNSSTGGYEIGTNRVWVEGHEYVDIDRAVQTSDGTWILKDEAVYIANRDVYCHQSSEEIVFSEYEGKWYLEDDVIWSEYEDSYLETKTSFHVERLNDEDWVPASFIKEIIKVKDKFGNEHDYLKFEVMKNPFTDEWVFKDKKVELYWVENEEKYYDKEDLGNREWTRIHRVRMQDYIYNKISKEEDWVPMDLYNYLKNEFDIKQNILNEFLMDTQMPLATTTRLTSNIPPYDNFDIVGLIKHAIWKSPPLSQRFDNPNSTIKKEFVPDRKDFIKDPSLKDFLNENTFDIMTNQTSLENFYAYIYLPILNSIHNNISLILTDKKMLKIFYWMKIDNSEI